MDKVLVLCVAEVSRKWGASTIVYQDSVMVTAEFADQVYPAFEEHFVDLARYDTHIVCWRMISYLPQGQLKKWVWKPLAKKRKRSK